MKKFARVFFPLFLILVVNISSAQAQADYYIKPNDHLTTYVFENPELSIQAEVPPDGIINFPLVGELNVLGLTSEMLIKTLRDKLGYYLIDPKVSVFVTAYNPLKVYILGSVRQPSAYNYQPGQRLTDYLTIAGGFDEKANMKRCYVYSANKEEEVRVFDLKQLLEQRKSDLDIELQPFDTVYVKKKSGFWFSEWRDVADALNIIVGLFTLYFVISSR